MALMTFPWGRFVLAWLVGIDRAGYCMSMPHAARVWAPWLVGDRWLAELRCENAVERHY